VVVPAGTFARSVTIYYEGGACLDRRVVAETLVPGVGLVRRVVAHMTPGGEIMESWALCQALVNSQFYGNDCLGQGALAPVDQTTWGAIKNTYR
jgi:hypothetical protein